MLRVEREDRVIKLKWGKIEKQQQTGEIIGFN